MYSFFSLLIICTTAIAHGALSPRIGSKDAPIGKYPYQISLRYLGLHVCGGSIIDDLTILTAAHCVERAENQYLSVHAGTNYLNQTGYMYKVARITIHEDFDRATLNNNVALIHLATRIKYNDVVQPIELAKPGNEKELEGKPCTLSGWGITKLDGNSSNSLQEIDLIIYPQQLCKSVYSEVTSSRICTFKAGQGACYGDFGSPLVANGTQIGIVSFVPPCTVGYLDIYMRVSSFGLWIWINTIKPFVY